MHVIICIRWCMRLYLLVEVMPTGEDQSLMIFSILCYNATFYLLRQPLTELSLPSSKPWRSASLHTHKPYPSPGYQIDAATSFTWMLGIYSPDIFCYYIWNIII